MISLHKCDDLTSIRDLKAQYLEQLVAPMDGMWNEGFTDPAPHWEIRMDGERAGYYAANEEGTMLQFYVRPVSAKHGRTLFQHGVDHDGLTDAVVSTIDPSFLSLCLDVHKKVRVHTYVYEVQTLVQPSHPGAAGVDFRLIQPSELALTVTVQQSCLGGDQDLSGWLSGYSGNLIKRGELFVLCRGDEWIGLGECRKSDSQKGVVDLGMMVIPEHRGNGWATYILSLLAARSAEHGNRPICSTTVENVAAQKAITRSGFTSRHRIMNVSF